MFCTLPQAWEEVKDGTQIGIFSNKDTLLEHELYLLSDSTGQPRLFYADILTPVCIDGICKPVFIELYWDLTGQYAGYGVPEENPLTKFDHDEFLAADYQKMDRLLADNNSVLRRRELSELFDAGAAPAKKIEYQGEELDAVSGATKKEIKESIVEGALYSCYTLWHLIHGDAAQQIEGYLDSIYSENLEHYFLYSDHEPYYYYALQAMEPTAFPNHQSRMAEIFTIAKPLSRTYLLKKMPASILQDESICRAFYELFSAVDINTKTLLVELAAQAHTNAMDLLADQIENMTKNQLKKYLDLFSAEAITLTPSLRKKLEKAAASQEYAFSYLIGAWLEE